MGQHPRHHDWGMDTGIQRHLPPAARALRALLLCLWLTSLSAFAVPSFSRQTGMACNGCHVGGFGPQLTAFGRQFKLDGYTLATRDGGAPLSVMDVASFTRTSKDLPEDAGPHDGVNDNFSVQEVSLFLAGRLGNRFGTFTQITYSDIDRKVAMDMMDVRYARPLKLGRHSGTFGISVNNNPGVQEVWNTSPAWRFPFIASELGPEAGGSTLLEGGLELQVLGATAYAYLDGRYYAELGFYRSLSASMLRHLNVDDGGRLSGPTPYYRFAYTRNGKAHSLTLGLTGLDARLSPDRLPGPTDHYSDVGLDLAYQYLGGGNHVLTLDAIAIHEKQRRNAAFAAGESERTNGHADSFTLNASCYFDSHYGVSLGYFDRRGDHDSVLYAPAPLEGSRAGKPDTSGVVLQADWTPFGQADSWGSPWANLRIGVQYTAYSKFNGSRRDYDGFGRNAGDNDTLFVFLWNTF